MKKARIPSPARSLDPPIAKKRTKSRKARSVGSPARSDTSGKLSTLGQKFQDDNMDSFTLSRVNRKSLLSDNTDIEQPRRKSWWKKLDENSQDVMEMVHLNRVDDDENILDYYVNDDTLMQEKTNYSMNIPYSSESESVSSIVLPRRQIFSQRDTQTNKNVWPRAHAELTKTSLEDKTMQVGIKKLFGQEKQRPKPKFSDGLITSPNKTVTNAMEVGIKKLFGQEKQRTKPKFSDALITSPNKTVTNAMEFGIKKLFGQQEQRPKPKFSNALITSPNKTVTNDELKNAGPKKIFGTEPTKKRPAYPAAIHDSPDNEANKTGAIGEHRQFFKKPQERTKPTFPAALLDISSNKTGVNTSKETTVPELKDQVRSLFGNQQKNRKNMFPDLIVSESEEEIPEVQAKVFGFHKKSDLKRRASSVARGSPAASITMGDIDLDDWNMLPSSTMMPYQLEQVVAETPTKKIKFGNLTDKKETSECDKENTTADKTIQQNKSRSKNKSKSVQNKSKTIVNEIGLDTTVTNKTKRLNECNSDETHIQRNESTLKNKSKSIENNLKPTGNEIGLDTTDTNQTKRLNKSITPENISQNSSKDKDIVNNEFNYDEEHKKTEAEEHKVIEFDDVEMEEAVLCDVRSILQDEVSQIQNQTEPEIDQYMAQEENALQWSDEENQVEIELEASVAEEQQEEPFEQQEENDVQEEEDDESINESVAEEQENQLEESEIENDDDNEAEQPEVEQSVEENEINVTVEQDDKNDENNERSNAEELENELEEPEIQNDDDNDEIQANVEQAVEESEMDETCEQEENIDQSDAEELENDIEISGVQTDDDNEEGEVEQSIEEKEIEEPVDELEVYDAKNGTDNEENEAELEQSMEENDESVEISAEPEEDDQENEEGYDDEIDQGDQEIVHTENARDDLNQSPNITYDTTGRNRIKIGDENNTKSPEAALLNDRNTKGSFIVKGRNTSVRYTNSMISPSTAPSVRDSVGTSGSNSSGQGSGWDSHRNERKTLRLTFGRDFTPRKSLRAMVMEKSAKRQTTGLPTESINIPQANSTEISADISETNDDGDLMTDDSDHDVSRRTRYAKLEAELDKVKERILARKQREKEELQKGIIKRRHDPFADFQFPSKSSLGARKGLKAGPTKAKSNANRLTPLLNSLPPDLREELNYKPPKRFNKASWCTKRLYKFLETKLEPKYDYNARVKAESLVEKLFYFGKGMKKYRTASVESIEDMKYEMARLHIVDTHHDFYNFCNDYLPIEMCMKVIPDIVNKIPLPQGGIYSSILEDYVHR